MGRAAAAALDAALGHLRRVDVCPDPSIRAIWWLRRWPEGMTPAHTGG